MPFRQNTILSVAIGLLLIGTIVTGVLAWQAVEDLDESLIRAETSLEAVDQTLVVTERLLIDTADALRLLDATFINLESASVAGTQAIADASTLAGQVPQNLVDIQVGLGETQAAAKTIDEVTKQLASVPLLGSGIKATKLAPTIDTLSLDLDPLIVSLEDTSLSLATLAEETATLTGDLPPLREQLTLLQTDLTEGAASVAELRTTAFGEDPAGSSTGLRTGLLKTLIVMATLVFAGTQLLLFTTLNQLGQLRLSGQLAESRI